MVVVLVIVVMEKVFEKEVNERGRRRHGDEGKSDVKVINMRYGMGE